MANMIKLEINGIPVEVPAGTSILNAARAVHVKIPTLCYHPDLKAGASCGICVVRNAGSPKLLRACCTDVAPGMSITTHDADIVKVRRTVLELILANHPNDCLQCPRSGNCELQKLAATANQEMRGHPQAAQLREIRMGLRIEATGEQALDRIAAEAPWRQADVMDDEQVDRRARGPLVLVGRGHGARALEPAACMRARPAKGATAHRRRPDKGISYPWRRFNGCRAAASGSAAP